MKKFSTDAVGFAALTVSELILQPCVIKGLFTVSEARHLLKAAARRHEDSAVGTDEKIALNMEAADLLLALFHGLEPLFRRHRSMQSEPEKDSGNKPRDTWVKFPD